MRTDPVLVLLSIGGVTVEPTYEAQKQCKA